MTPRQIVLYKFEKIEYINKLYTILVIFIKLFKIVFFFKWGTYNYNIHFKFLIYSNSSICIYENSYVSISIQYTIYIFLIGSVFKTRINHPRIALLKIQTNEGEFTVFLTYIIFKLF